MLNSARGKRIFNLGVYIIMLMIFVDSVFEYLETVIGKVHCHLIFSCYLTKIAIIFMQRTLKHKNITPAVWRA